MSVRKIPLSRLSLTALISSPKQAQPGGSESSLERDFYILLDFDVNVEKYVPQPVRIPYCDSQGNKHNYTPDVLIYYRDDIEPARSMKPLLCEVKYRRECFEKWKELKPKLRAARAYARARGWNFRIITEREIRTPYLENAKFLRQYRNRPLDWDHAQIILDLMREFRETDPESLLLAASSDRLLQAQMLPALWHLIVRKMIGVDLTERLTMKSRIYAKL
jgi:hypothetical protein